MPCVIVHNLRQFHILATKGVRWHEHKFLLSAKVSIWLVCGAESTTAAVATAQAVEPLHAPEVTIKPAVKKKGAVIGSAPKLSHEGLVAAAKAAEEKAAAEKRALQLAAKKAAAAEAKANRKKPKLAAPGGGIGFQGKPAQTSAVTPGVPEGPTATGVTVTDDLGGQTPVVDPVSVQGKIYQGKWSRKKQ